jgi:hypothetical protein
VPQHIPLPEKVSIDPPVAVTPHVAAPRATPDVISTVAPQPHRVDLAALNAHPCESALQEVEDALTAVTDQPRYASSVRALYYAAKCGKRAIRLRTRALALTQKAIAEHDRRMGDWHADISESFNVAMQCAKDGADANDPNGLACHALANQQAQLALIWQIDR